MHIAALHGIPVLQNVQQRCCLSSGLWITKQTLSQAQSKAEHVHVFAFDRLPRRRPGSRRRPAASRAGNCPSTCASSSWPSERTVPGSASLYSLIYLRRCTLQGPRVFCARWDGLKGASPAVPRINGIVWHQTYTPGSWQAVQQHLHNATSCRAAVTIQLLLNCGFDMPPDLLQVRLARQLHLLESSGGARSGARGAGP